jgi:YD repeat-containing protein
VLRELDRNGHTINYNYDFQNRVWQKNYPDSTTTQFNYDGADRLSQVTDPTGTYTFTYDNMCGFRSAKQALR